MPAPAPTPSAGKAFAKKTPKGTLPRGKAPIVSIFGSDDDDASDDGSLFGNTGANGSLFD